MYLLVLLYFSFRSIFLMDNGNLQIFDLFFILNVMIYYYIYRKFDILMFKDFGIFIFYIALVNLFWSLLDLDLSYLRPTMMYIYNFIFVLLNISLYKKNSIKYKLALNYGILLNIIINLIIYLFKLGRRWHQREFLLFGDPNQLSYYFLTMIIISDIFNLKNKNIIKIFSIFFMLISSSRMGLIVYLLYESLNFLKNIRKIKIKKILISIIIVFGVGGYYQERIRERIGYTLERFKEKDEDDSLISRGWDRIYYYPEYMFLGSGEGGFKSGEKYSKASNSSLETHSSWANIILSYGLIGIFLFSKILLKLLKNKENLVYLIPLFAHGMVKVDTRQTVFWLILNFILLKNNFIKTKKFERIKKN